MTKRDDQKALQPEPGTRYLITSGEAEKRSSYSALSERRSGEAAGTEDPMLP